MTIARPSRQPGFRAAARAVVFGALTLGALASAAGPRTAIVDDECTTARGKVVDCTQQKCVNREGRRVTTCPGNAPAPVVPASSALPADSAASAAASG
jgi:hypothetical protein